MSVAGSQLLPSARAGGISLMAGVVLAFFPSLFTPGGWLVSPVDQSNYAETLEVLSRYSSLAHVTAMAAAISMLLYGYGLLGLLGLRAVPGSKFSSLLQFGVITSLFGWGIFLIAMGKRHMTVHLMQRSTGAGDPEMQDVLFNAALNGYADMAGLILAFLSIYPFASMMVGLGLARRFASMNIYKIASIGLFVVGAAGFINFVVAQHFPAIALDLLLGVNNSLLSLGALCLFIVGVGMYRQRRELLPDENAS
ncbi:MAG: hypothetical protein OXN21_15530 [Chloroflexota bacterium]|nr:hypothetical protein [Chloroflexota bacterium]